MAYRNGGLGWKEGKVGKEAKEGTDHAYKPCKTVDGGGLGNEIIFILKRC